MTPVVAKTVRKSTSPSSANPSQVFTFVTMYDINAWEKLAAAGLSVDELRDLLGLFPRG